MAWIEKRRHQDRTIRFRIRDRIDGKKVTVVEDAGIWREIANARLTEYDKGQAASNGNAILAARRVTIEEACDLFFKHHSPGLTASSARDLGYRLKRIQRIWEGIWLDDITKYHVRDLLAQYRSVGDRLKYLRALTTLFNRFEEWNEDGKVLGFTVKIPLKNPATKWRKEMKPSQKKEHPRERVLTLEEWQKFRPHLTKRAMAICDLALRRFLRTTDIRRITHLSIEGDQIRGLQKKTGEPFLVPTLSKQPKKYDFTNFREEFLLAQIAADMNYPVDHPLHFNVRDLRRTGATWAYKKTKDLVGISKMLGHTNIKTTIRYLHIDEVNRRAIADAIDEIAGGAPVGQIPKNEIK